MRGSTGQTGYVTSDGNNNGPYCWNGSAWVKYAQNTQINSLQSQIAAITQGYESGTVTLQTTQLGAASVRFAKHKTKPKAVLVTRVRNSQAQLGRVLAAHVLLPSHLVTYFQRASQ